MTIRKFRQFFQVRCGGYTVAQFTQERSAREFIQKSGMFPVLEYYRNSQLEVPKVGFRTRRISIYP